MPKINHKSMNMTFQIPDELQKQFKQAAAKAKVTMTEVLIEAVKNFTKQKSKK